MNESGTLRPTGLVVRPAQPTDLAAVVRIERESFTEPWSHRSFADLLVARHVIFLVGVLEADIAGYAVILVAADESELANLAVDATCRGRGIGRDLLAAALDGVRRRGAKRVFLEVRASNLAAQELYRSAGFTEIGRRQRYYRLPVEDALVMQRATDAS
jgi:ribosomal-protein-alanine N-acetyltransferase